MDITLLTPKNRQIINRYGNGGFIINEVSFTGNVLIFPDQVLTWPALDLSKATPEAFQSLFTPALLPEILLIGAGKEFMLLPAELRALFRSHNIAVDVMDTGAACRTYNVLLAEDRRVGAALVAV